MKSLPLIVILAIAAIIGFVLFFWNQGRLDDQEQALQTQMEFLLSEQEKIAGLERSMTARQAESEQLAEKAVEAQKMAEAQVEKGRLEREKLVAELNARLQKEAEERRQAEIAQQELQEKMEALKLAQQEAQIALTELQNTREKAESADPVEEEALKERLVEQEKLLVSLEQENQTLKMRQKTLTEQQVRTEEAILDAGGKVDIAYPEIRSPNVKRRQAIYFKERVVGSPTPGN